MRGDWHSINSASRSEHILFFTAWQARHSIMCFDPGGRFLLSRQFSNHQDELMIQQNLTLSVTLFSFSVLLISCFHYSQINGTPHFMFFCPNLVYPVGWSCKTPLPNKCPGHDTKQSDGEVSVMLELWGMQSTSLLPSLPRSTLDWSGSTW